VTRTRILRVPCPASSVLARNSPPASPLVDAWNDRNLEHEGVFVQLARSSG
jgi:hypothetical protein